MPKNNKNSVNSPAKRLLWLHEFIVYFLQFLILDLGAQLLHVLSESPLLSLSSFYLLLITISFMLRKRGVVAMCYGGEILLMGDCMLEYCYTFQYSLTHPLIPYEDIKTHFLSPCRIYKWRTEELCGANSNNNSNWRRCTTISHW